VQIGITLIGILGQPALRVRRETPERSVGG
jgi:hypothetical protein